MKRTIVRWSNPDSTLPEITYEELDIMKMEIAPAFRGYGRKGMIIENPLSAKRAKEIEEISKKLKAQGKDRFEIQNTLMPFKLPLNYKAKNERFGLVMSRKLKFEILKYNPSDPNSRPHIEIYELEETPGMTLFVALNMIERNLTLI